MNAAKVDIFIIAGNDIIPSKTAIFILSLFTIKIEKTIYGEKI